MKTKQLLIGLLIITVFSSWYDPDEGKIKIIIIGDYSAANNIQKIRVDPRGRNNIYEYINHYPEGGWGMGLGAFFNSDSVKVINYAKRGIVSSKSFLNFGLNWSDAKIQLRKGDVLFIQFGHGDSYIDKYDEDILFTEPYTTYKEYLSIYIDAARDKGAYPVLLTPVHLNYWSGDSIIDTLGNYPDAMRQLAAEKEVPLIDLHKKTKIRWEELGQEYVTSHIYLDVPYGVYPNGGGYYSHKSFSLKGAWEICKLIKESILEQQDIEIFKKLGTHINNAGIIWVLPEPGLAGGFSTWSNCIFPEGRQIEIVPEPESGKALSSWKINEEVVSTERTYKYTVSDTIFELTGCFVKGGRLTTYKIPSNGGNVEGAGTYINGTEVELLAHANPGYQFVNWIKDDIEIGTDTILKVTINNAEVIYWAYFEKPGTNIANETNTEIKLFPNPADNWFSIYSGTYTDGKYSIFNIHGQLVQSGELDKIPENKVDISSLNSGVYMVQIKTMGFDNMYLKFIKR